MNRTPTKQPGRKLRALALTVAATTTLISSAALAAEPATIELESTHDTASPLEHSSALMMDIKPISPFKVRGKRENSEDPIYTQMKSSFKPINVQLSFGTDTEKGTALTAFFNHRMNEVLTSAQICQGIDDAEVQKQAGKKGSGELGAVPEKANEKLAYCAKYHPDEFAVAANILQPYMEWRQTEVLGILDIYDSKLTSPHQADRVEARYILGCIADKYGEIREDTESTLSGPDAERLDLSTTLLYCTNPENWDFTEMYPKLDMNSCMDLDAATGTPSSVVSNLTSTLGTPGAPIDPADHDLLYVFDSKEFITNCVVNKYTALVDKKDELAAGLKVGIGMLPSTRMEIRKVTEGDRVYGKVNIQASPMGMSDHDLNNALYERSMKILASGGADGCIPSPFVPDELFLEARDKGGTEYLQYCSIRIPTAIMKKVSESGEDLASFMWSTISKQIATIQTLEVLNGATMVSQEAFRILNASDNDLGFLMAGSSEIMRMVTQSYKNSIDLAKSSKLENVLTMVDQYYADVSELKAKKSASEGVMERRFQRRILDAAK